MVYSASCDSKSLSDRGSKVCDHPGVDFLSEFPSS
jgi:GNAT superfamily N-acetyltransferase